MSSSQCRGVGRLGQQEIEKAEFLFSQQRLSKDTSIVFFFSAGKDKDRGREQSVKPTQQRGSAHNSRDVELFFMA